MARIIQTQNGLLKRQFFIRSDSVSICRSDNNQIQLDERFISLNHAQIYVVHNQHGKEIYFLKDLGSTNGSYINKNKITCKQLKHKDHIRFAHHHFTFIDDREYLNKEPHEKIT